MLLRNQKLINRLELQTLAEQRKDTIRSPGTMLTSKEQVRLLTCSYLYKTNKYFIFLSTKSYGNKKHHCLNLGMKTNVCCQLLKEMPPPPEEQLCEPWESNLLTLTSRPCGKSGKQNTLCGSSSKQPEAAQDQLTLLSRDGQSDGLPCLS